jgi:hypothetical protein
MLTNSLRRATSQDSVRGDENTVGGDKNGHRRSVGRHNRKTQASYSDPQFMRRNDRGTYLGQINLETSEQSEIISAADIDVSYDGKRWFHLFVPQCLRHEKPFYIGANK